MQVLCSKTTGGVGKLTGGQQVVKRNCPGFQLPFQVTMFQVASEVMLGD